ncbi:MAG: EVE domain-containing protein [Bacteriovoracaceae bacterium]
MRYWLFKSEPDEFSIDDLEKERIALWEGVRNYQARNFMRDNCAQGDLVLFYHSSCKHTGVAGLAKISREAIPDPSQFDPKSPYFDSKADAQTPRWHCVEVQFQERFKEVVSLSKIKENPRLRTMLLAQKGSRLSIQPVEQEEFKEVLRMARQKEKS